MKNHQSGSLNIKKAKIFKVWPELKNLLSFAIFGSNFLTIIKI